jgi:intein/homing endonuclease
MELMEWGLGYAKLAHKVVPSKVFTSHTKVQSAFLRGLFESDGGSGPSSPGIYFTNTSRSVCQGAHLLLTNLGILTLFALETPAKDNNSDTYTLFGAGVEVHHFENKVGFIGHRKISNLKRLTKRAKGKTNVDFLPHTVAKQLAVEAYRLIKARGLSAYKLNKMNEQRLSNSVTSGCYNKHGLSVGHAKELLLGLERLFGIDSEFSTVIAALHKLTGHRVFFDHVAKVERVEDRSLLDIEVPETESYWTNGFISHNSKGLEWQTVFISSVYEGSMPHMYSMGNDTEIEEERRLFYVALTRAKDRLVICVPTYLLKKTSTGWNKISVEPSRFLAEIGIV